MILSGHVIHDESVFPYRILHSPKLSENSKTPCTTQRPIVIQIPVENIIEG